MKNGELSNDQRKKFADWINSKSTLIGKCPICSDRNWTLTDHFIDLPIYRGGNVIIGGGPSYPNVGLICQNCGNTHLINAVISGIVDKDGAVSKPAVNETNE